MLKKITTFITLVLLTSAFIVITGCGGGGGGASTSSTPQALIGSSWYFSNEAPDLSTNGATCFLNVLAYYSDSVAVGDIDSLYITAPNQWHWTIPAQALRAGTSSKGTPYVRVGFYYGNNPQAFPLAGVWKVEMKLKSGETSSLLGPLAEPGSSAEATHKYLYIKEDWTPATNQSEYVAALGRFPSYGYSASYSPANGGRITTSGLSPISTAFLAAQPSAYNFNCWLYDVNGNYIGYTNSRYSQLDHADTGLVAADGELSIVPAATYSSTGTGTVDLAGVRSLRIVYTDGAQFAPASYSSMTYRSISGLVAVN